MAFTIYLSIFSAVKVEYAVHELNSCTRAMISAETNVCARRADLCWAERHNNPAETKAHKTWREGLRTKRSASHRNRLVGTIFRGKTKHGVVQPVCPVYILSLDVSFETSATSCTHCGTHQLTALNSDFGRSLLTCASRGPHVKTEPAGNGAFVAYQYSHTR